MNDQGEDRRGGGPEPGAAPTDPGNSAALRESGDPPSGSAAGEVPAGVVDWFAGALFRPRTTFAAAAERVPVAPALVLLTAFALLEAPIASPGAAAVGRALATLVLSILFLAVGAAGLGFLAELVGGRGRSSILCTLLLLTVVPRLALLPLQATGFAGITTTATVAAWIWSLVLTVLAVRSAYRLSDGQAVATLGLGLGLLVVVPIVLIVVVAMAALSDPNIGQVLREMGSGQWN